MALTFLLYSVKIVRQLAKLAMVPRITALDVLMVSIYKTKYAYLNVLLVIDLLYPEIVCFVVQIAVMLLLLTPT
jgi:hypothetical protein